MGEPRRVNGKTQWVPLTIGGQGFMYSMVDRYIVSVEETYRGHVRFHRTSNKEETVENIVNIFIEFQKPYTSRHAWDASVETHFEVKPWSLTRIIASRLPGIGSENSLGVEKAFNVYDEPIVAMINATEMEWAEIELTRGTGKRKLGKATAKKIYEGLRGKR